MSLQGRTDSDWPYIVGLPSRAVPWTSNLYDHFPKARQGSEQIGLTDRDRPSNGRPPALVRIPRNYTDYDMLLRHLPNNVNGH